MLENLKQVESDLVQRSVFSRSEYTAGRTTRSAQTTVLTGFDVFLLRAERFTDRQDKECLFSKEMDQRRSNVSVLHVGPW